MTSNTINNVASKFSLSNITGSLKSAANTLTGKSKPAAPVDSMQIDLGAAPKAPVSPAMRGLKVAGKTAAIVGGSGALLAAAGYGLYAAAPHISALVGTIGASPMAVPVLATIGVIAAIAVIGLAVRAIYKAVQSSRAKSLAAKQDKAADQAVAAEVAAGFAGKSPAAIAAAVSAAKVEFAVKKNAFNDTVKDANQDAKNIIEGTFKELLKLKAMASFAV